MKTIKTKTEIPVALNGHRHSKITCQVCNDGREFKNNLALGAHMKVHAGERIKGMGCKCSNCGLEYSSPNGFYSHRSKKEGCRHAQIVHLNYPVEHRKRGRSVAIPQSDKSELEGLAELIRRKEAELLQLKVKYTDVHLNQGK